MKNLQSIYNDCLSKVNYEVVGCNRNEPFQYKCRTKKAPA